MQHQQRGLLGRGAGILFMFHTNRRTIVTRDCCYGRKTGENADPSLYLSFLFTACQDGEQPGPRNFSTWQAFYCPFDTNTMLFCLVVSCADVVAARDRLPNPPEHAKQYKHKNSSARTPEMLKYVDLEQMSVVLQLQQEGMAARKRCRNLTLFLVLVVGFTTGGKRER